MNAQEFATTVRKIVLNAAVDDTISNLEKPPGRRPATELAALSGWYLDLPQADQEMVRRALAIAAHAAVFGLFAVIDGARRFDDAQPHGKLQLSYERPDQHSVLSGSLHDLLNSEG